MVDNNDFFLKTKENNIIEKNYIIHSQRTEYIDFKNAEYIPLYDLNIFYQYDFYELATIFRKSGFIVDIIEKDKSVCFFGRKQL